MGSVLRGILVTGLVMSLTPDLANADLVNHWISSPEIANVVYRGRDDGNVEISFSGTFDFTPIAGSLEPFSGHFLYQNGGPFAHGDADAFYSVAPTDFSIFGSPAAPVGATVYVSHGVEPSNDQFYFQVTFGYGSSSIPIPHTSYGLESMGLNAGAYPPNVLTGWELPRNLDVMAMKTGDASLWAEYVPSTPVPVPGAVLLGALGLSFAGWRLKRQTT
jgi:hypothetical protein